MTTLQALQLLLALDLGALWACAVMLTAMVLRRRAARAVLAAAAADVAADAARTAEWEPGWNAPTAPVSTIPAADPWQDAPTPPQARPMVPVVRVPVAAAPRWTVSTAVLARLEQRRKMTTVRPRNDAPAAAQPRYVELLLTRRP